jgi:hypothetical protein
VGHRLSCLEFSCSSSAPTGKYQSRTSISPQPFPIKSLAIHHVPISAIRRCTASLHTGKVNIGSSWTKKGRRVAARETLEIVPECDVSGTGPG